MLNAKNYSIFLTIDPDIDIGLFLYLYNVAIRESGDDPDFIIISSVAFEILSCSKLF